MMGPPYWTYGLRVPASCVLYAPEAQGSLPRGQALLYARRKRASLGRAARTMHRGIVAATVEDLAHTGRCHHVLVSSLCRPV